MTNLTSYCYSGLVYRKNVGVVHTLDQKGLTVVYKTAKSLIKPAKGTDRQTMKVGARIIVQYNKILNS